MDHIENFKQPLTEGELHLLKFLDNTLKKDEVFKDGGDLTQYNGWLIFVQPFLNGSRPDIIIFNPNVGVQIIEVKDWNLNNYSFRKNSTGKWDFYFTNSKGSYPEKSPIKQVDYYKEKLTGQLIPQIGEEIDKNDKRYALIRTSIYCHKATTEQAQDLFRTQKKDYKYFPVFGIDLLTASNLNLHQIFIKRNLQNLKRVILELEVLQEVEKHKCWLIELANLLHKVTEF